MADKKPIVGIDLGIDPEYLEGVVKQTVIASVSESLLSKEELAKQVINTTLSTRVDKYGNVSSYRNDPTLLEYLVNKAVKEAAQKALEEAADELQVQVKEVLKRKLAEEGTQNAMCNAMFECMMNSLESTYRTNIDIKFEADKSY